MASMQAGPFNGPPWSPVPSTPPQPNETLQPNKTNECWECWKRWKRVATCILVAFGVGCVGVYVDWKFYSPPSPPSPPSPSSPCIAAQLTANVKKQPTYSTQQQTRKVSAAEYILDSLTNLKAELMGINGIEARLQAITKDKNSVQKKIREWTHETIVNEDKLVRAYLVSMSDVSEDCENIEFELVGLWDTTAQLIAVLGDSLKEKLTSAQTDVPMDGEVKLMQHIVTNTCSQLQKIKPHVDSAKHTLGDLVKASENLGQATVNSYDSVKLLSQYTSSCADLNDQRNQFIGLRDKFDGLERQVANCLVSLESGVPSETVLTKPSITITRLMTESDNLVKRLRA